MKRLALLVASISGKAGANEAAACVSRGHFKGCAVSSDNYSKEVQPLSNEIEVNESVKETWWVPHPRSGIFHPEGQQNIIDGVAPVPPSNDEQTIWFRS